MEITWGHCPRVPKENGGLVVFYPLIPVNNFICLKSLIGRFPDNQVSQSVKSVPNKINFFQLVGNLQKNYDTDTRIK
jgi:hypothetical protein